MVYRAIFLDRDGTLVHSRHYPSRPEELQLYRGIRSGLRRLQLAEFKLVVVTNQSGIARGYFSELDLERMHLHLRRQLARASVRLDGIYYCPHHPDGAIPALAMRCTCRKPQPGMALQAAADLDLDLGRSWFVGDILNDIEAGRRAGCRTVLVDLGTESPAHDRLRQPHFIARDTRHALRIIAAVEGLGPHTDLQYVPARWQTSTCEATASAYKAKDAIDEGVAYEQRY